MYKPSAVFTSQLSPQRKLALKVKKPVIKVTTTLQKSYQHKYNNSEIVTPKYPNPIIMAKAPATTTAKRARDVPKLLFAKVKQEQDYQLTTTRAKRHKYVLSENMAQFSYNFPVPKPRDSKLSKQMSSPQKFMENLSSTESLLKAFTPRGSVDEEKKNLWQTLKYPTTPSAVLKLCMHRMNHFEQAEILNYPQIYFIGNSLMNCKEPINKNYGYDDDKGDYKIVIGDHIAYRYEIVSMLGRGSFGQVVKAMDHKTKLEVALKVIRNKARFHEQAMVEIDVLKYLKEKDPNDSYCVVHLEDHFAFRKHMCITFELLSINLYEFLKSNSFHGLSPSLIRRFSSQILYALMLLDRYKIIHCDLKPENIILKCPNRSSLKVIDFGSSCFHEKRIYTYIQSRFYRAPEIMLGISYTTSIDMWSLGCIMVELFTGYPLFPGESEVEQMQCIMEVLGLPSHAVLERATRKKLFFESDGTPKLSPNSRGKMHLPGRKSLKEILKGADSGFIELVSKCLEWDPTKRFTPEEALAHDWMVENIQKLNKSNSRGGSAQPHQGLITRHGKKLSDTIIKPALHRSNKKSLNLFN